MGRKIWSSLHGAVLAIALNIRRAGVVRLTLGSLAYEVLRASPLPVPLVRPVRPTITETI